MRRNAKWLVLFVALLVSSAAAVAVRVLHYPAFVPRVLGRFLEWFVEPGATVGWLTLGGVFEGFPSSVVGYLVVVVANVAFWCLVAAALLLVWKLGLVLAFARVLR